MKNSYTKIDLDDGKFVITCNDCGSHAQEENKVIHHKTCKVGESKKWEEFYSKEKK